MSKHWAIFSYSSTMLEKLDTEHILLPSARWTPNSKLTGSFGEHSTGDTDAADAAGTNSTTTTTVTAD
ncbi:hypothetical protein TYRP_002644 [Tyrophagus putrescentiae]|nr:hypothetical protein TYRP_002644 [Tyrophagus putrescentiae]